MRWLLSAMVRPAAAADLSRILEIARQSASAAQWSSGEYEKMLRDGSSPGTNVLLVIEAEHKVLGFLAAQEISGEWEIENLAIFESARRSGLGLRLLTEFLRIARERHGKEVFLEVRESNLAARSLYSKCTFVEAGRRKSYYHNPEEDALILRFSFFQGN